MVALVNYATIYGDRSRNPISNKCSLSQEHTSNSNHCYCTTSQGFCFTSYYLSSSSKSLCLPPARDRFVSSSQSTSTTSQGSSTKALDRSKPFFYCASSKDCSSSRVQSRSASNQSR